jgi:hypothetical protein
MPIRTTIDDDVQARVTASTVTVPTPNSTESDEKAFLITPPAHSIKQQRVQLHLQRWKQPVQQQQQTPSFQLPGDNHESNTSKRAASWVVLLQRG